EYQLNLLEKARQAGDVQAMAESYNNLVVFYTESQDFSNAVTFQQKYLELAEQYHLRGEEARSYNSLGLVYEHGGNFQKALEAYRRSLELYQELGETQGMAINLRDMGRIYLTRYDNYSAALEYQTKALELFQEEGDDANTIDALQNLGLTYEKLANYRQALEYQSRALSLSQEIQDTTRIGLSYQYLANLSWKTGDYQTALKYQRQALDIFEKQQAAKLQLIGLATEGLIYMSLGQLEDGLKVELRALEIAEKINERLDQATIHKNIGLMYSAASQLEKALASFQKATQIDEALGSKRGLAYDYRDLGSLFSPLNRVAEAKTHLTKALRLSTEIGDGRNEAQCLYELGRAYHSLGNVDSSLQCLQEAVQKASYLLIPEVEWRAYRYLAKIQEEKGKLSQSLESLQKAVEVIEAMRSRIKVEEYKSGFIDDKLEVYGDLVLLLLKMGRTGEAFEAAERAKSRNFIDMLANREISFKGQASTEMLAQGDSLKTAMGNLQVEISILRGKGTDITVPETEKLAQLEKELQRLKSRYENYLIQLKEANRELAGLVSVDPWSLEQVQQILPQEAAILEYFLTNNEVILWTITAEKVQATTSKIPLMELGELVQNFRKGIERRLSIENLSRTLYKILDEPARKSLEDIHHLVIIPHGILHYLPFAALMDGNNRYLVEDFNLSLAPSATVLGFCLEKGQSFVARPDWEKKVLALGNPDLGNPALALPFATQEISSLQITYPQVQSYLEKAATEKTFKTQSPQANLILLSCHGEYDATNPLFSALLLTPTAEDDGRLEAHEIFGLNLNAYLIAMSACETGLGTITGGDEVIGLSRSFIFAGASSLMASLWKVDDLATAVLVKRFFRYLKQGQSRSEALRNAQMLVKNEINAHPAFWAAFTLTGDFR
ncbi:MAG: CHAT domain-containing protein, partial [candidate division KSB1 bacterium]|nr:CHAT domain-containing protein [candidate division KSB1 bacterium]